MGHILHEELQTFVNNNIDAFHESKIGCLQKLSLRGILRKKNPYLFRAKNIQSASELVQDILDAYLSSSEEKLFGDFLESLALFVANKRYGALKSSTTGIDLDFVNEEGVRYLISVKSGPNWANSSSMKRQATDFQNALKVVRQSSLASNVQAVLGICYGKNKPIDNGFYLKVTGQAFWNLISGDSNLYTEIVEPLGYKAKEHNEKFLEEKQRLVNLFTQDFLSEYSIDGRIDWIALVRFNSGNLEDPEPESLTYKIEEEGNIDEIIEES